jgi:phosphate transport system substrate-binding protein
LQWLGLAFVAFVAACGLSGCDANASADAPAPIKISIAGSTALVPLLDEASKRYMKDHPAVTIVVSSGGSYTGLANQGAFDDAITSLTSDETRGIFTGRLKNWNDLGGEDQPIVVINREKGSGTRGVFGALVLGGDLFVASEEQPSSSKVQERLLATPGAISYLALSYHSDALKTLAYENVAATTENILTGAYPLWSYEHLYTRGQPSDAVTEFIAFVTSGRFQREVLPHLGFIPIHDMKATREPHL